MIIKLKSPNRLPQVLASHSQHPKPYFSSLSGSTSMEEKPSNTLTLPSTSTATTTTTTDLFPQDNLSTAFTLYDPTWNVTKKRKAVEDFVPAANNHKPSAPNYPKRPTLTAKAARKEAEEERRWGVSTRLSLYDPWRIKKTMTASDLGQLSRLLLSATLINHRVVGFLDDKLAKKVETKEGAEVTFYDSDTNTEYQLIFKLWETSRSYVFIGSWNKQFVKRRGLKKGDEIGLYWDTLKCKFIFSLLKRASQPAAA